MRNSAIIMMTFMLCGCGGMKAPGYSQAQQLPPLEFPPHALAVSHRYDIPKITSTEHCIIDDVKPPYY